MKKGHSNSFNLIRSMSFLLLSVPGLLFSQPPQEWVMRYNGAMNSRDVARDVAVDAQGNIYVTGISQESTVRGHMTTFKYDPDGNVDWADSYAPASGSGNENIGVAISIQPPAWGGNIFVGGTVMSLDGDYAIAKYSPDGIRQWMQTYSGLFVGGEDYCVDVAADPFGGVYAFGAVNLGNGSFLDLATVRFDSNGTQLWEKNYSGASSTTDIPRAMAVDDQGRAYVIAKTYAFFGSATFDYTTICYLPDGTEQWVVEYDGPGHGEDQPIDIVVDKLQNQYITGWVTGSNGARDFGAIMQNLYGTRLWAATYNGSANGADSAVSVAVDGTGNVYIAGHSLESLAGNPVESMTTISYDPQGNQRWIQHYFGIDSTGAVPAAIQVDGHGGVYVGGSSKVQGQPNMDYVVVKYDTAGMQQWAVSYDGAGNSDDQLHALALDHQANLYVTGQSIGSGTQQDYTTIRYTQNITGISDPIGNQPGNFTLYQNYPNPFNPTTNFKFSIAEFPAQSGTDGFVSLKIYDLLGREVAAIVNERLPAGSYEYRWDANGLASGVYVYSLEAGSFRQARKLMLLK